MLSVLLGCNQTATEFQDVSLVNNSIEKRCCLKIGTLNSY